MKFLKEERNAYQYKGHTVIQTSSGYRIKDGNGAWVGGEFDTDRDAHEFIDGLKESFFPSYERVASKSVLDSDGFYTDYTWYKSEDGLNVFVFGDNEVYTPEEGNFDFETENDDEAQEWFDSYTGFEEDLVEGKESSETHLKLSGNMIEIPIEDNSEVGELGHPIQQGIGDPRRKREVVSEATATLEKPLSNLNGTLSSVLLAHKDEVDTLFDKRAAVEFLDRIAPEVKNKSYLEKVKQEVMRGKRTPVEYFYNIILKGDGDGTEKGGKISKKAQINKWAKESLNETWSRGDEVTLWWIDPKWSQTAPCYASCEYVGKARDGRYRFKSTTYGWEFLLDTVDMTVTTPQGKTFAVDNSSGWLKDVTTEGWIAKYVPERGDKVTIIGNVYMDSQMRWGTETDEFIGATGTIEYAGSRYSTFDSIEIKLDDGTKVWTVAGYRPVEKNPLKESYNVQFYQIFKNPEKPTDNGKMIAQAGTEDEAKAKGDKLVGKGNYLIKAVCDDGKVRDVDLYSYFNESEEARPLYIIRDSHGNQLSAPNPDDEELWDRVASMEARGRRGLCVVAYTGRKESLKEWNEFSDDDVEDDLTHAAVYGGDSKYCKECGAVKAYDEDGFAYCPECCGELEESYYIGDELLRAKQDRLSLELEDGGWTEVDSKSQDGTYWTFFRKMVDGKGQWKAVVIDSVSGDGEIVDVTYGQARGYEPLSDMDALRKDLGNKLLPR